MTRKQFEDKMQYLEEELEAAFTARDKYEWAIEDCISDHVFIPEDVFNKYNLMASEVGRIQEEMRRLTKKNVKAVDTRKE